LLAFIPGLAAVFTILPAPVMEAILVYVACFKILGGIQVITSRMLDARRTFVVGIPFIFGLSVAMVSCLDRKVPGALAPMFGSSLSMATILVIVLNLLFRIGVKNAGGAAINRRRRFERETLRLHGKPRGAVGAPEKKLSAALQQR
jgi:NCS2 family nucleobase:cation symporter-2